MDTHANKESVSLLAMIVVAVAAMVAKLRETLVIREGYEDETGFHFGRRDSSN